MKMTYSVSKILDILCEIVCRLIRKNKTETPPSPGQPQEIFTQRCSTPGVLHTNLAAPSLTEKQTPMLRN